MKKLSLIIATYLILTVAAWAQGGGGGAGGAGGGAGAGSGGSAGSGSMGTTGQQGTGSVGVPASDNNTTNNAKHEKTMEGCIVQQGSDFFLATHNNKKFFRLSPQGGTDLSAHVGHKVKVHGSEQASGSLGASTSAGTSGTTTSA